MIVYGGEALSRYGFGEDHPFGSDRFQVFWDAYLDRGIDKSTIQAEPVPGSKADALLFHTLEYVEHVEELSVLGQGMLDADTPVFPGVYEAALTVVGTVLDATDRIVKGDTRQAFIPIAGLHHARRDGSAGFCVFNDCGIAIEALRARHGIRRIAYVDIDAHHGDGVFYAFEEDSELIIADLHEDGRFLYPGTGHASETGKGIAAGTKLNVPLPPGATDELFFKVWPSVLDFLERHRPEFIILQCGADSIAGDPITHLSLSPDAHRHAASTLKILAEKLCNGKLLPLGGGGYNRENLATTWNAVIEGLAG